MAKGFKVADAYVEITTDLDQLRSGVREIPRKLGPDADNAGRDVGGKLSQGIRMSVVRNSPLIAAAIAGGLAAGAPVAIAGATTLFAGIGIVAAAQADKVQSAWLGTWQQIKAGAIADAKPIEDVLVRMSGAVSASFERMRPAMRDIFEALGPQIESVTGSLLQMAENAMPGLTRAVQGAGPVMDGFGAFLERVGTGLSDFFDKLTAHSPAAGEAFAAIGDIIGELLPILGELLGQGAELAADVLPPLADALGVVADVASALGPMLPAIVAGFTAMKIANTVTGGIGTLAAKLGEVAVSGGAFSGLAGKMSGGLGAISAAAGPAAAGIGLAAAALLAWVEVGQTTEEMNRALGRAFEVGGGQAEGAAVAIQEFHDRSFGLAENMPGFIEDYSLLGYSIGDMIPSTENATNAYEEWRKSLDEGADAAEEVKVKTDALKQAVDEYGPGSREAAAAAGELARAEQEAEAIAGDYEMAISGVTEAMLAQADAALALADADLAHRQAMDQADESYAALGEAIREHGAASEEASDAAMAWEADLSRVVATAGKLATETLPAGMDANSRMALSQIAQRDALRELAAQYGDQLPVALQTALASLEQTTAGYDVAALEAAALGAATEDAGGKMDKLAMKEARPKITGDASIFAGVHASTVDKLDKLAMKEATPKVKGDASIFAGVNASVLVQLDQLGRRVATPAVNLADRASGNIDKVALKMAMLRDRTVTITTYERTVKTKATGGPIVKAATGRKVYGPGGPTEDLVEAIGPSGEDYRLSAGEWIINAMASRRQGDAAMAMLNAGQATIVPTTEARGFAIGGTFAESPAMPPPSSLAVSSASAGPNVNITIATPLNLMNDRDLRRAAAVIRAEIIKLERAQS